jgi:hypothetical protein
MMKRSLNRMVQDQDKNGAGHGHQETVQIQAGCATGSEETEHPSSSDRTENAEHDVKEDAFSSLVDDLTGNEASQQTQHNPT